MTGVVLLAIPVKDGVEVFVNDLGGFNVTVGASESTMNATDRLSPVGFPAIELFSVAIAMNVCFPLGRVGLGGEVHSPFTGDGASTVAMTEPL
jgi:hypothetical protein